MSETIPRTPLERAKIVIEGIRMARDNARRARHDGDEPRARAAFRRAYGYVEDARMFMRLHHESR